jgi:hypothetical protein
MSANKLKLAIELPANAMGLPMRQWQEYFASIYSEKNAEIRKLAFSNNLFAFIRGYSIAHISQDLGNVAEYIREGNKAEKEYRRYIGSLLAWVFALSTESGFSLEDIIWKKFPGKCHCCQRTEDCQAAWWTAAQAKKGKTDKDSEPKATTTDIPIPGNLDAWVEQWDKIYGRKIRVAIPLYDIMHKLYEELAEVLGEYDKGKDGLEGEFGVKYELPDFMSWFFALIIKLQQYGFLDGEKDKLGYILWQKFHKGCPEGSGCGKPKCECKPLWVYA